MVVDKEKICDYLKSINMDLNRIYNIEKIGLIGSFARNEASEKSDIDIVYILKENQKLSYFKLYRLEKMLEKHFSRKIELINYKYINPIIKYKSDKDIIYV
ncbi:MAG: nucleotidyltransferase domain-containing protein [Bacteroidales bacterium]|nr:nucleotidyltransferase domain-containing protein [Bacteroidales bacterium]MBN2757772.1 nucleotidyltransferase domain-containing protein [Bacteroidales bacterium]